MFLKRINLTNFMSFYGKHELQLQKGLNVILGPCGSGKTNLARALRFALLGNADVPRSKLINSKHKKEAESPFCEVEVKIEHKGRGYFIQDSLCLTEEKKVQQVLKVDPEIDGLITSESFKHIYLNPLILGEFEEADKNYSHETRIIRQIVKHLDLNLKAEIGTAIIDGPDEHLTSDGREKLLSSIDKLAMEQLIVMRSLHTRDLEAYPLKIHRIEYDLENDSSKFAR